MSTPRRSSSVEAETRCETPASTTSTLLALASDSIPHSASSTPPTSIGDAADSSQIEKQESPAITLSDQPLNEVEVEVEAEARATQSADIDNMMPPPPPPPSGGGRSLRRRTTGPGTYDVDAMIRRDSGHLKRGPRRADEVVKDELEGAASRRQTMSDIPAFDNNDSVHSDSAVAASSSRSVQTPDNQGNGASYMEGVEQGTPDAQSDGEGTGSATKNESKEEQIKRLVEKEIQRKKVRLARELKEREKAESVVARHNNAIARLEQDIATFEKDGTPSALLAPAPSPKLKREVRRLEDTKEYKKDEAGVIIIEEVWVKGKKVDPNAPPEVKKSKKKIETPPQEEVPVVEEEEKPRETKQKKKPTFLDSGLYAGSEYVDPNLTTKQRKEQKSSGFKARKVLPLPMGALGRELLGKDIRSEDDMRPFMLPFEICNPVHIEAPSRSERPPPWKESNQNKFVGEAKAQWKSVFSKDEVTSRCQCVPKDGCADHCINRGMSYECTEDNCKIGVKHCTNRAFADLAARTANKKNFFNVGVEVVRTGSKGFGVRSNRAFKAGQIIVEYCGEIITEEECDRRMHEKYRNQECYYLMLFDQKMIIDAQAKGSIARFVNHSCDPNCQMVKLVVAGEPRMALFADRDIVTGEELTYDYNYNPFSDDHKQKCYCGTDKCRGYLMPKSGSERKKESRSLAGSIGQVARGAVQAVTNTAKGAAKTIKTMKRKANELVSPADDENAVVAKKRKTAEPKSPAKKVLDYGKKVLRTISAATQNDGVAQAVASGTPKLNASKSFLGVNGSAGAKKQTTLSFFQSSNSASAAASKKRKASPTVATPEDEDEDQGEDSDSHFFVPESEPESEAEQSDEDQEDEQEEEDVEDVVQAVNKVTATGRKPLPNGPPSAPGAGGNRIRLLVNPSPLSSAPASGQTSREASPGPPIVSSHADFVASKRPRFRAVLNKTQYPAPPAPTPGPVIPKRVRKRRSTGP